MWEKIKEFLIVSIVYGFITVAVFFPRFLEINTTYSVSGLDTDSAIWSYEREFSKNGIVPNKDVDVYWGYPLGYKRSKLPYTYGLPVNIIHGLYSAMDNNYSILIALINLNAIIPYCISAILGYYFFILLGHRKFISFCGGLLLGFSYYGLNFASGSLLNSHIWVIYLWFYVVALFAKSLESQEIIKKNIILILIGLIAGMGFWTNFYYGFFSLLFSPILFAIFLRKKILYYSRDLFLFYFLTILGIVAINFNYFLANIGFVQGGADAMSAVGRVAKDFSPLNEMLHSVLAFFIEHRGADMDWNPYHAFSVGYVVLVGLFIGLFHREFLKKNILLYISLFFCIILYTYIPFFYPVNWLYFFFFGAFKGVLRFMLITNFLAIWIFINVLSFLIVRYAKYIKLIFFIAGVFVFIQFYRNIPYQQKLWSHRTDFIDILNLYEILKDERVQTIASYPMYLENNLIKDIGGVPNYQLLGQMVHHKPLAGSVDINAENLTGMIEYFYDIKDIDSAQTIDNLQKYGINTIVLYNNLLKNEGINPLDIHKKLMADERILYLGGRKISPDNVNYITIKDLSMDISVYLITSVRVPLLGSLQCFIGEGDTRRSLVFTGEELGYNRIRYLYSDLRDCEEVTYYMPKDSGWKMAFGGGGIMPSKDLTYLKKKDTEYFNTWEFGGQKSLYVWLYHKDLMLFIYGQYIMFIYIVLTCSGLLVYCIYIKK